MGYEHISIDSSIIFMFYSVIFKSMYVLSVPLSLSTPKGLCLHDS